jgi:hypothetical protein
MEEKSARLDSKNIRIMDLGLDNIAKPPEADSTEP